MPTALNASIFRSRAGLVGCVRYPHSLKEALLGAAKGSAPYKDTSVISNTPFPNTPSHGMDRRQTIVQDSNSSVPHGDLEFYHKIGRFRGNCCKLGKKANAAFYAVESMLGLTALGLTAIIISYP